MHRLARPATLRSVNHGADRTRDGWPHPASAPDPHFRRLYTVLRSMLGEAVGSAVLGRSRRIDAVPAREPTPRGTAACHGHHGP
jgi:hypothetical protein